MQVRDQRLDPYRDFNKKMFYDDYVTLMRHTFNYPDQMQEWTKDVYIQSDRVGLLVHSVVENPAYHCLQTSQIRRLSVVASQPLIGINSDSQDVLITYILQYKRESLCCRIFTDSMNSNLNDQTLLPSESITRNYLISFAFLEYALYGVLDQKQCPDFMKHL